MKRMKCDNERTDPKDSRTFKDFVFSLKNNPPHLIAIYPLNFDIKFSMCYIFFFLIRGWKRRLL